ncbi:growth hormone secretagogue receptor type 1 [Lingula anatina]|uniref:Growth hormone secretagogue receptor type 1 n=1 Tax=Lingula anatina TaxID=7574 RepID=A0A1S3HJL0_LINAN|nr:growth hormone secretagogue receptor type 1 [Lingula anatina]|eukprot:XP_013385641.1 growth hormone secretagogue receptor type 1 [Lingula anatina]
MNSTCECLNTSAVTSATDPSVAAINAAAEILYSVFPLVFLVFGSAGNILAFVVVLRKPLRHSSSTLYLAVLAIADLGTLWFGLSRHILLAFWDLDIRKIHSSICKLQPFLLYSCLDYSAWILAAVTVERFISVHFPLRAHVLCTRKRARSVVLILALLVMLKNFHVFITRGDEYTFDANGTSIDLKTSCGFPLKEHRYFWVNILPWIVFLFYAVGPFTIILTMNILIIRKVLKSRKARKGLTMLVLTSGRMANGANQRTNGRGHNKGLGNSEATQTTVMLITVSLAFLLLATPSFLHGILGPYWRKQITNPHGEAMYNLVRVLVLCLNYTNHSINFILYCISGKRFRTQAVILLTCGARQERRSNVQSGTANTTARRGQKRQTLETQLTCVSTVTLDTPL